MNNVPILGNETIIAFMTALSVRERLRAMGRLGYLHPCHYLKYASMSFTLGSEGLLSPQAGNACKRFESENSLSCPNTMVAANLNYLSDPSDKREELGTKESTVEKRILS